MPRTSLALGATALLIAGLLPALSPATAATGPEGPPRDEERYVDVSTGQELRKAEPDVVATGNGRRIEIYSSVGDNELGMDWRTVNQFAYLVDSVPKGKNSYTTLFNSLYDFKDVTRRADGSWTVDDASKVFSPTAAYLNQVNLYSDDVDAEGNSVADANRRKYIHVLGAKESIDEAYAAGSSLAKLVLSGYNGRPGKLALDYEQCPGDGGCLSGPTHLMHSKYGAFEEAKDSNGTIHQNVVWMTSSNLNGSSGSKKANVSIVIFDDKKAYDSIVDGIYKPSVEVANGKSPSAAIDGSELYSDAISIDPATGVIRGMPTDSGVTLFPSPRAKVNAADKISTTDVEAAFLKKRADDPAPKSGCKVYAVHSLFNSTRDGVRDGLARLKSEDGCDVRVVLGENAIADLVDGYFNMSEDLRELIGRVEFANVHDKTISYKDSTTATTFGGASNLTGTSLEFDELAFKADNLEVTDAVQAHSERVYQLGKGQTTWATPTDVSISPTGTRAVRQGGSLKLSPRVSPRNALVTKTEWSSSNPAVPVSPEGVVTAGAGTAGQTANITVKVSAPEVLGQTRVSKTSTVPVKVVDPSAAESPDAGGSATIAPTLTMDNYQSPTGSTGVVVTWGSGADQYDGVVKLQYYSGGWKTYPKTITVKHGVGRASFAMGSSKTWRAYGARLDRINDVDVPNSTTKTMSKWSINTVRTRPASTTPRLYATSLVESGAKIPFLVAWDRSGGTFRLQQRSAGGSWKTHSTWKIPSGSSQEFIVVPVLNTKYWRIATSTGSTKVSNTVKVAAK